MVSNSASNGDDEPGKNGFAKKAQALIKWLLSAAIDGGGPLPSAQDLAEEYLQRCNGDVEKAIQSLIVWQTSKGAGTGFLSGLGGLPVMPFTLPASMIASYGLGARLAAAIAHLRGYDLRCDSVRTTVLLSLLGDSVKELLKGAGIVIGLKVTHNLLKQLPGKILIEINRRIGFRLLTKFGEKGVINFVKMIPLVGGVIGAVFDSSFVFGCGKTAKQLFPKNS